MKGVQKNFMGVTGRSQLRKKKVKKDPWLVHLIPASKDIFLFHAINDKPLSLNWFTFNTSNVASPLLPIIQVSISSSVS